MFEELFFSASGSLKSSSKALDLGWTPSPPSFSKNPESGCFYSLVASLIATLEVLVSFEREIQRQLLALNLFVSKVTLF